MAPVAAEIIAGRPPRKAIDTAMVNEANSPMRGSTPAMIENEIASGIRASATTRPARTSVRSRPGERSAVRTVGSGVRLVLMSRSRVGSVRGAGRRCRCVRPVPPDVTREDGDCAPLVCAAGVVAS